MHLSDILWGIKLGAWEMKCEVCGNDVPTTIHFKGKDKCIPCSDKLDWEKRK